MSESIEIADVAANGMVFRTRRAGAEGDPVLLLHGFPETSHMWTELIPLLVANGYRCVAPDQRGYSPGARPEGKEHYDTGLLVGDVLAIADALEIQRFHLIGHDWGAGVGWRVVMTAPERIASWTALSIPHPASYARAFQEDPDQQQRSQYIGFFQQEGAAEASLAANDWAALKAVWTASSPEELAEYLGVFTQPGALTAALNWYRAAFGEGQVLEGADADVSVPTLTVWGNQDQAVGRATTETADQHMKGYYRFVELNAGHWLVQEKLEAVSGEILEHLRRFPL